MKKETQTEETHDLAKWLAGEMTQDELSAFENTPEFAAYERIATTSLELRTPAFDQQRMLEKVLSGEKKPVQAIPLYRNNWLRVAAVLVIGLGLFFALRPDGKVTESTIAGKMGSAVLPDNSEVALNSGSKITYDADNWDRKRELSLEGEAYFKVAKGRKFDVVTKLGKVTVVGTKFNVKARGERFEVECYEGRVKVSVGGSNQVLTPGMMLVFDNGVPKGALVAASEPAWTKGLIRFVSSPIDAVVSELERKFDVKIVLRAKTDKTVTGTFSGTDLRQAIEKLCAVYKLSAKTENNVVILSADE